jgi:hypothetical protein
MVPAAPDTFSTSTTRARPSSQDFGEGARFDPILLGDAGP